MGHVFNMKSSLVTHVVTYMFKKIGVSYKYIICSDVKVYSLHFGLDKHMFFVL